MALRRGKGEARSSRSAKAPGFVFCGLAAGLLALIATALSPVQPPPPPTAAYAPEAVKPIKAAPPDQTSQQGHAAGKGGGANGLAGGPGSSPTTTTTLPPAGPAPTLVAPPTAFDCVGSPPRQIPDPESPPCVTTVVKNNGGQTYPGVTANEIRIAIPNGSPDVPALINFFNERFDFYGRKLVVVNVPGCFGGGTPQSMSAHADSIAQQNVFAVVGWCDAKGTEYPFYDELAHDHVISIANRPGFETESQMAAHEPFEWTFWPTFDVGQTHLGDLACSLAGRTASYAGAPQDTQQRKFGLFYDTFTDAPTPDTSFIMNTLAACGVHPITAGIPIDRNGGTEGQGYTSDSVQDINSALLQMRQANVTDLIDLTHADTTKQILQEASAQSFEPEQLVSSYLYNDFDADSSAFPPDQQAHLIGISTWNKQVHPADEPWYYAVNQGDPGFQYTYAADSYYGVWYDYYPLLVLAAGIQMAGPGLTPSSFSHGLQDTAYPNPITNQHEGLVSIHPGQHSYVSDASIIWFDPAQPNADYQTAGSFCFFADGARLNVGYYPANPALETPGVCPRYG